MNLNSHKLNYISLSLISLISLIGAIVYKFHALNWIGVILTLSISLILFYLFFYQEKFNYIPFLKKPSTWNLIYLVLYIPLLYLIISSQTSETIISPWEKIPHIFFLGYLLLNIILFIYLYKRKSGSLKLVSLHYFLSFSIALIIYKLGYGFDIFIHEASQRAINKLGSIDPKPFYYLGQYSLVVILHKLSFLSISFLNKILVPVLASLFLPFNLYLFLKSKKYLPVLLLALILPMSVFIVSLPQNLAYLFLILTILSSFSSKRKYRKLSLLLSVTTFSIHPLAGIPALLFSCLNIIKSLNINRIYKQLSYASIFLISGISLPVSFWFINKENMGITWEKITSWFQVSLSFPSQETLLLNWTYLYGFNVELIIALLIILGVIIAYRYKIISQYTNLILIASSLLISYILFNFLSFDFLISYEKNNYQQRILVLIVIFLLPVIILTFKRMIEAIQKQRRTIQVIWMIVLSLLIVSSVYISYPRQDKHFNSHGHSISKWDKQAVNFIETHTDKDYIVLANQQVSAAALQKFGFSRYHNDLYFYPIPTGGKLYNYYLDMVKDYPKSEYTHQAMEITDTEVSYLVLNDYWWASDKIKKEAQLEAERMFTLGPQEEKPKIYIFKYTNN